MKIREATSEDIRQIQIVRHTVKENVLSDPALVTDDDCEEYLNVKGKGWVCEINGEVAGFAIADLAGKNIWALFLRPEYEKKGIGRKLHDTMIDWYFSQTDEPVWLSTDPGTRAEKFYRKAGWTETGLHGKREIRFEMTRSVWNNRKK